MSSSVRRNTYALTTNQTSSSIGSPKITPQRWSSPRLISGSKGQRGQSSGDKIICLSVFGCDFFMLVCDVLAVYALPDEVQHLHGVQIVRGEEARSLELGRPGEHDQQGHLAVGAGGLDGRDRCGYQAVHLLVVGVRLVSHRAWLQSWCRTSGPGQRPGRSRTV